jgi:hypothetical protein
MFNTAPRGIFGAPVQPGIDPMTGLPIGMPPQGQPTDPTMGAGGAMPPMGAAPGPTTSPSIPMPANPFAQQLAQPPVPAPQAQNLGQMTGIPKGPSGLQRVVGALGDGLAQWSGGQPLFAQSQMMRTKALIDAAKDMRDRALKFSDMQQQRQFDIDHPEPDAVQKNYNFILSTQGKDVADVYLKNVAAGPPVVTRNPDGTYAQFTRGDTLPQISGNSVPQVAPPGVTFTPIPKGGATPNGSGTFPKRN